MPAAPDLSGTEWGAAGPDGHAAAIQRAAANMAERLISEALHISCVGAALASWRPTPPRYCERSSRVSAAGVRQLQLLRWI